MVTHESIHGHSAKINCQTSINEHNSATSTGLWKQNHRAIASSQCLPADVSGSTKCPNSTSLTTRSFLFAEFWLFFINLNDYSWYYFKTRLIQATYPKIFGNSVISASGGWPSLFPSTIQMAARIIICSAAQLLKAYIAYRKQNAMLTIKIANHRVRDVRTCRYLVFWTLKNTKGPNDKANTICNNISQLEAQLVLHAQRLPQKYGTHFVETLRGQIPNKDHIRSNCPSKFHYWKMYWKINESGITIAHTLE